MTNKLKRIAASIMAVASLTVGTAGMSVNAAELTTDANSETVEEYSATGSVNFGPSNHAKAGIYRDSSQISISTSDSYATSVTVKLTSATYGTLTSGLGLTYAGTTYVSHGFYGSSIQSARASHTATENSKVYTQSTAY